MDQPPQDLLAHRTVSDAGAIQGTAAYTAWGEPQGSTIAPFGFTGEPQGSAGAAPGGPRGGGVADLPGLGVVASGARPDLGGLR